MAIVRIADEYRWRDKIEREADARADVITTSALGDSGWAASRDANLKWQSD